MGLLALFLLGVLSCCNIAIGGTLVDCNAIKCVAVVDAGSTGSRLHVYSYDQDNLSHPINIKEVYVKKVTPGFATVKTTELDNYLSTLFLKLTYQNIPIYFYATAGMRLLPEDEQMQRYQLLQEWSVNHGKMLQEARTILGSEEALFDWLSVNYTAGAFTNNAQLTAVTDIGGASTQVALVANDSANIAAEDKIETQVYGKNYTLFAHSFLGLGADAIFRHFQEDTTCFAKGYNLIGDPDPAVCAQHLTEYMNDVYDVNKIVHSAVASSNVQNWMVLGAISSMVKNTPFSFKQGNFTLSYLLQQTSSHACLQNWQDMQDNYSDNPYLFNTCLNGLYYYALTTNGYGLNANQSIQYSLNTTEPDWTLGVVLHQ